MPQKREKGEERGSEAGTGRKRKGGERTGREGEPQQEAGLSSLEVDCNNGAITTKADYNGLMI